MERASTLIREAEYLGHDLIEPLVLQLAFTSSVSKIGKETENYKGVLMRKIFKQLMPDKKGDNDDNALFDNFNENVIKNYINKGVYSCFHFLTI